MFMNQSRAEESLSAGNFDYTRETMSKHRRALGKYAAMAMLAVSAGGCSWFGGGDDRNTIQPQPTPDVYRSPLKADVDRTGDYRRGGLLGQQPQTATRPATRRIAPTMPTPLTATTAPAMTAGDSQYLVLGSVVANVNGAPIYANDLLQQTAPLLRARARELQPEQFRSVAQAELKRQRQALIEDELVYAAAQRNTTPEEQREAQARTFMTRERMISQAGGSLQMAQKLAREQGTDFDTELAKAERTELARIYFRKRVMPRATMTVDEMRRYYERNRDKQFTSPSTATIRVVRIDVSDVGSDAAAKQRAEEARARIAAGENFDAISDDYNKQGLLRSTKGLVGPLSKGSYAVVELDDAIWKTPAGQATPVVKSGGSYYVALVQERKDGRVQAFDEADVQNAIEGALKAQKINELRQRANEELQRDAVIQADDAMLAPAVEMAMQLYPNWHAGGK